MYLYSHDWTLFYVACNKADEKKPLKVEQDRKKKTYTKSQPFFFTANISIPSEIKKTSELQTMPCIT